MLLINIQYTMLFLVRLVFQNILSARLTASVCASDSSFSLYPSALYIAEDLRRFVARLYTQTHCPTFASTAAVCCAHDDLWKKKTRRTNTRHRRSAFISPTQRLMYPNVDFYLTEIFFPYNIFCENSFSFIRHSQSRRESCDSVLFSSPRGRVFFIHLPSYLHFGACST